MLLMLLAHDCFKWVILAGMHPVDVNADRRGTYVEHMYDFEYHFSPLSFPVPLQAVGSFACTEKQHVHQRIWCGRLQRGDLSLPRLIHTRVR